MGFSESNVRHPRAPPSKASRQPAGLPRPLCGLSEACLFSSPTGPARKRFCRPQLGPQSFFYGLPKATLDTHGPRPQTLLGSRQACPGLSVACPKPASSLHPRAPPANVSAGRSLGHKASSIGFRRQRRGLSAACPKPASSLHPRAPPANASRQPGPARKRFCRPQLGPQSFFYGLPKATLDTHRPRPQKLLGSRAPPANVSAGRSLAHKASSMGFRRQRRGLSVACPKPF